MSSSLEIDYVNLFQTLLQDVNSEPELLRAVRQFRRRHMVGIAIRDMCMGQPLTVSLDQLSSLADCLISQTLLWLHTHFKPQWGVPLDAKKELMPLVVLGMGKLGGQELNFSSDIDLIFTYPVGGETQEGRRSLDHQTYYTRIGQKLINALDQVTADGFAYRVDMRLRPFGDSGPLVLSFSALEDYYQEQGRDWERYAMLKARVIGNDYYKNILHETLRPFVFRRYIDFSVIESLRQMKQMIAQEVRRRQLTNNIKLGAGGIREVEFIAQVFQLIRGGREPELQTKHLLGVLPKLVASGDLAESSYTHLNNGYRFLRRAENVIQAIGDQQTQTLPETSLDQARVAHILGFNEWQGFLDSCHNYMDAIHNEFNQIIGVEESEINQTSNHWVELWQSNISEAEAISILEQHQVNWDANAVTKVIFDFKQDVNKRGIGQRGQIVLDKLVPNIFQEVGNAAQADNTLARIFHLIIKIVSRTAYLELLYENKGALTQLVKLCAQSEWVALHLAKFPILLDELIDPKLLYDTPKLEDYSTRLRLQMLRVPEDDLELQMETLRQFKQAQQLHIAAADISGILSVNAVSAHLTAVAEAIIAQVVNIAWQQMAQRFGVPSKLSSPEAKDFAVIGYGKSGGFELGYGSDLDLVFVHCAQDNDVTNGEKEVLASQFYLKLAQRILHIFNARTTSGILYEADMRLRPSGNSGLMVVHLKTFESYQHQDAWTWEHQALVRARMLFGSGQLKQDFARIRNEVLNSKRDLDELRTEVIKMREKMRGHLDKSDQNSVDIKQSAGGLVDIEFLAQYLVLANAHKLPEMAQFSDNLGIFRVAAKHGILTKEQSDQLITVYKELRELGHKKVLQQEDTIIESVMLTSQLDVIKSIWQQYLGETA